MRDTLDMATYCILCAILRMDCGGRRGGGGGGGGEGEACNVTLWHLSKPEAC